MQKNAGNKKHQPASIRQHRRKRKTIRGKQPGTSIILDYILEASKGEIGIPSTLVSTAFSIRPTKAKLVHTKSKS